MCDNIKAQNKRLKKLKFCDYGAGSGYFLYALKKLGNKNIEGYEVMENQIKLGNLMLKKPIIKKTEIENVPDIFKEIKCNVLSLIGVLEHFKDPYKVLENISSNKNINYLFISVPMFSLSVFFEIVFPNVMSRVLPGAGYGGHTHLYTEQSLNWIEKKFNLSAVSRWWFGSDLTDLYRSIFLNNNQKLQKKWRDLFEPLIDDLQFIIDKKHLSSEVHILFKKKNTRI